MAFETKDDTGALFKNERKQHERQPDYRGTGMVNGKPVDIAAWIRTGKASGKTYLSLTFSESRQDGQQSSPPSNQASKPAAPAPADDFPF